MFRQSMVFPPPIHGSDTPPPPPPQQPTSQPPPVVNLTESSRRQQHIATASSSPVKSHPLHNFPLSDLRWAMNHTNTHRLRKASSRSPLREANTVKGNNPVVEEVNEASASSFELRPEKKKGNAAAGVSDSAADRSGTKSTTPDGRSKIFIRIRTKNSEEAADIATTVSTSATDNAAASVAAVQVTDDSAEPAIDADVSVSERISDGGGHEADEFGPKVWNLRPRKPPPTKKRSIGNSGGVLKSCNGGSLPENKAQGTVRTEAIRSRNGVDAKIATIERKEKKPRLSISLSKLEIDEDIYALTGSKPSRRPKKRAKNVQKQLDVKIFTFLMDLSFHNLN